MAGGVFLAAGLLHILPDATEAWENGVPHDHSKGEPFPMIPFVILCSFSGILLIDRVLLPGHAHDPNLPAQNPAPNSSIEKETIEANLKDHDHQEAHVHAPSLGPYVLVVAMGVHALFEGLALGLRSNPASFYGFMTAIVSHKWAECMAVGINFLTNGIPKLNSFLALLFFSFLTPIGIIIGMAFTGTDEKTKAILYAISCGTFLYIAIAEIIAEEFEGEKGAVYRYLAYFGGATLMVVVWWVEQWGNEAK